MVRYQHLNVRPKLVNITNRLFVDPSQCFHINDKLSHYSLSIRKDNLKAVLCLQALSLPILTMLIGSVDPILFLIWVSNSLVLLIDDKGIVVRHRWMTLCQRKRH